MKSAILASILVPVLPATALCAAGGFERAPAARPPVAAHPDATPAPLAAPNAAALAALERAQMESLAFDTPGDGSLWARGADYKVAFDARGATYFPRLGRRAPQSFPHHLSPDRVTLGENELAFEHAAPHERHGARVDLDRGAFVERYDLAANSLEQSFVFTRLPGSGALELHIPVESALEPASGPAGLEFRGELGRITYGRASVVDAHGAQLPASTELVDGAITIRVAAEALANAALPLTIDPVVILVPIENTTNDTFSSDVAWDPIQGLWLVTYEQVFSATDSDVYADVLLPSGTLLYGTTVDFTSVAWHNPRCADMAGTQQFLVVAEVATGSGTTIKGRTVQPNGTILTTGPQFDIGGTSSGNKVHPEVGGDPYPGTPSFWCVTYEEDFGGSNQQIVYQMIDTNGALSGPHTYLAHATLTPDLTPSISKSDDGTAWLIAWTRVDLFSHSDIYAAHVGWNGVLLDGPFGVTAGGLSFDFNPSASSPITSSARYAIAFSRRQVVNGDINVAVAALDGTTVTQVYDLTAAENSPQQSVNQIEPVIDCDGRHFLVCYGEFDPFYTTFYDICASDLYLSNGQFGLAQTHITLQPLGLSERRPRMSSMHSMSQYLRRFLVTYDVEGNSVDHDVDGNLFDDLYGGGTALFCGGDGSSGTCPCGNSGQPQRGCANSANAAGARCLPSSGIPSTLGDTLVLTVDGTPATATCIFLQGSAPIGPTAFGDGLRCTGGTLVRLFVKQASGGTCSFPAPGDGTLISVRGGVPLEGGTYAYQVYYRDPASFCTALTYNISNGVLVSWAR